MSSETEQQQKTRQRRKAIIFHKVIEKAALGGAIFLAGIAVVLGLNMFWQFVSGGVVWNVLGLLIPGPGASFFIIGMQVIWTALVCLGLWYIATGRGSEMSI